MNLPKINHKYLLSGNEAVALAAKNAQIALATGYPGTPSTEILETFSLFGGKAQWSPNEKVAMEVAIGSAFAGARTIVTMKHVGVNVAADPLFTCAYTGTTGGLVLIAADDPGMASSQNEQDTRRYAQAAGVPLLEPSDSQEAYDLLDEAMQISEKFKTLVILRMTTRVCHSKSIVTVRLLSSPAGKANFVRDIPARVMVPAYARPAHKRLRVKLANIASFNEAAEFNTHIDGDNSLGIIASGISWPHAREAYPNASFLKLTMSYPLPLEKIRKFASSVKRCVVIEEGDPVVVDAVRAAGINAEGKHEMFRFGELNVNRIKRIVEHDFSEEPPLPKGKPPQLCVGCPHRITFEALRDLGCIVSGDIGCYTLGVLPPFEAMDTCVCMGASITLGLGLRHSLGDEQAQKVVSVIGDSTFVHSGLTGIAEMVYNPPKTGHVVMILDNSTTAMTGLQEHPGTGRKLDHTPAGKLVFEEVIKAMGVEDVTVVDPVKTESSFKDMLKEKLQSGKLSVIIVRRVCLLAAAKIKQYETQGA